MPTAIFALASAILGLGLAIALVARTIRYGLADIADAISNDDTSSELDAARGDIVDALTELADVLRDTHEAHAQKVDAR